LRPTGLKSTQFTILQALGLAGEVTQGRLGEILAVDSTTLTRTLAIMRREGWVAQRRGADRRQAFVRLSAEGQTQLQQAEAAWQQAQDRLRQRLGPERWADLARLTQDILRAATVPEGDQS
jgi:DNA-binding MarR family transcriptional regulator